MARLFLQASRVISALRSKGRYETLQVRAPVEMACAPAA